MGVKENKDFFEVAEFVAAEGNRQKEKLKMKIILQKTMIICVAFLLCTAIICGTIFGIIAFREQQWALNSRYNELLYVISGTEKTVQEANADDGGTAIAGNNNSYVGGDVNGDSENDND